jgi:alkylation response protein AidB-like acyl-CoA dehydrogenase
VDLDDSPAQAAFRAEVRAFLAEHGPTEDVNSFSSPDEDAVVPRANAWQRTLFDHGWAALSWPREFGGRGAGPVEQIIWNQELARCAVGMTHHVVGVAMVGPALLYHGTPAQQERHLARILAGDEIWCELFSEPGFGSDLAGVQTRAVRDGDEWVLTGQKVWSSGAHRSDLGLALARTDPDAAKHAGISAFIVDMHAPGVECRPLRQLTGTAHFNEVFLTDVRVPADAVVGDVDRGWDVARTVLMHERMALGGVESAFDWDELAGFVRDRGAGRDPVLRRDLARLYSWARTLEFLNARVITKLGNGEVPTAESSIMKLALGRVVIEQGRIAMGILGAHGVAPSTAADEVWALRFLSSPAMRIGGGTDEIQRNIIAERVLGLPREPA